MKSISLLFVGLAACVANPGPTDDLDEPGSTEQPGGDSGQARLDVLLTDAPGDFESVWVDISRVEIESPSGWLTLTEEPQRFDLLTLQNDVTAALGGAMLEPGSYGQLRLFVDHASVVIDGVESPLKIASGAQSGIKIDLAATIEADTTYTLVLDYDAHASIKLTGAGYLMTPVIVVKDFVATPSAPEEPIEM